MQACANCLTAYPDAAHLVCELCVHAEDISLGYSSAGRALVQNLVLGTAEGVCQPHDVLLWCIHALLDVCQAQLLNCSDTKRSVPGHCFASNTVTFKMHKGQLVSIQELDSPCGLVGGTISMLPVLLLCYCDSKNYQMKHRHDADEFSF